MMNPTTEELNEKNNTEEEGTITVPVNVSEDAFEEVVKDRFEKIQRQNLLLGAQTVCKVVLDKIIAFKTKQGKPTMNDYKRLVKDVQQFCETGLSRKVNADGETEPVEKAAEAETVQN